MTCRKGHDLHPDPYGPPHDSCIGICHWLYSASLFASFDILNTLDLMSHKGQGAELLELWFIWDRKLSTDLCPTQSEQLLGPVNVSEKHINGNVASQFQKSFAFFFFFLWEGVTLPALWGCYLNLSQISGLPETLLKLQILIPSCFLHSFYIHCLTKCNMLLFVIWRISEIWDGVIKGSID